MKDVRSNGFTVPKLATTLSALFPSLNSGATWDRAYAREDGEALQSQDESARYAVILGHLLRLSNPPALLDVGCGSGRLLEFVARCEFASYLGLDISTAAIQRARALKIPSASFAIGSAESFSTDRRFDAIIFGEVAYYLQNPSAVLLDFQRYLRPNGIMIVSMYDCLPARFVWWRVARAFDTVAATEVVSTGKHSWSVRVVRPKPRFGIALRVQDA